MYEILLIRLQLVILRNKALKVLKVLRVIFLEYRESENTHEKSIFLSFHQNIPGELTQGKIV